MKPFALEMQQGITPNTPAAKRRWGVRLTILLFLSFGTFLGTPVGFCQQPTSGQKSKVQEDQQKEKTEGAKDKDAASSAKAQKPAWHIQVQKQEFGGPLISISAKKAPLGPIMAELERQVGIPVVLTRFQVRAHEMALTEAAEAIAVKASIPFIILSRDYNQKELDQKVDWDIKDATLEEIAAGWFPDAVRLYLRTDFETGSTRPLRITLERSSREQPQQGEGRTQQNVEP